MLVSAKVIDNQTAVLTQDHISVEPARGFRPKVPNPRDRLSTELIDIRVVPNIKWHISALFGEHNPSPTAQVKKGQCVERTMPYFVHNSGSDTGHAILALETKSLLNPGMQAVEVIP
jgi:hypothetical protein